MNRWELIKDIDKDDLTFGDVLYHYVHSFNGTMITKSNRNNVEHMIKCKVSEMIHTFFPFLPISDLMYSIDIEINPDYMSHIGVHLGDYNKYLSTKINKNDIKKELRYKKLNRIVC